VAHCAEYDSYKSADKYESKSYDKYDKHDNYEKSADEYYEKSSDKYDKYEKSSDKYYDGYDSKEDYYKKDYYGKGGCGLRHAHQYTRISHASHPLMPVSLPCCLCTTDPAPPPAGICQSSTFGAFYTQELDIDIDEPNDLDGVVSAFVGCNERTTLGGECSYVCYDGEHYERFVGVATRIVTAPPQEWDSVDPWYHPVYCAWALGGNVADLKAAAPSSKKTAKPGVKQDLPPLFSCDFTIRVECCDDVVPLVPAGPEIDLGAENGGGSGGGGSMSPGSSGSSGTRKIRRRLTRNGQPVAQIAAVRDSPAFTRIKHSKVTGGFMGLQKHGAGTTKASTLGLAAGDAAAAAMPEQQHPAAAAKPRARAGHTLGQSMMAVQQRA
jgi:hypothetical protein